VLRNALDNERWKQVEITSEIQGLIDHILTCGLETIPTKKNDKNSKGSGYILVKNDKYASNR